MLGKRFEYDGAPIFPLNKLQKQMKKQIELKIKHGIYQFKSIPCCTCSNEDFEKLSKKDRYGLYSPVVVCKQCGLIQTNPRMNQKSYNDFYKFEYRKLYLGERKPNEEFFTLQYKSGKRIFSYLQDAGILTNSSFNLFIFEIGCGAGGILQYFREKGYNVQGCDLDEKYLNFGRKNYNLDLFNGTIKEISLNKSPDIIIFSHVLEHLLFPKKDLEYIFNLISDNGYIYIEVPSVEEIINSEYLNFLNYLQNAHTYHFTLTTLRNLLEGIGFKMIKGNRKIISIFKKSNIITSNVKIVNNYKAVILYLKKLEGYRNLNNIKMLYFKIINWIKQMINNDFYQLKQLPFSITYLLKERFIKYFLLG